MIACAADKILASDVSIIGSVGVRMSPPFFNVVQTMEKLGVNALTLSAGKDKDTLNPTRPWKPDEQESYQHLINYLYDRFTDVVTANRPQMSKELLISSFGAHVFPAPEAVVNGYIDSAPNSRGDALIELASLAGIPSDQKVQIITFETKNWMEKLFYNDEVVNKSRRVEHHIPLIEESMSSIVPSFHYQ